LGSRDPPLSKAGPVSNSSRRFPLRKKHGRRCWMSGAELIIASYRQLAAAIGRFRTGDVGERPPRTLRAHTLACGYLI
jgi:hypothetical protein